MTDIAVIIPTFNRDFSLNRALCSVLQQSLSCSEIIVVDDGSTDDTVNCVENFAAHSTIPIRYLYQDNQGPAAARNTGIRKTNASYLAFLDSDDHWHKKKLELQFSALSADTESLVSHTREKWLRRGVHLNQKKIHQPGEGYIFNHCLQLCAVGMSTVMVRKELFEKVGLFNEKMRCCEDYDFWLRTSSCYPFLLIDVPLTIKEGGREDQVSWQYRTGMDKFRIAAILDLLRTGNLAPEQVFTSLQELKRKCLVYGKGCIKHLRSEEGECYLLIAGWADNCLAQSSAPPFVVPENPLLKQN